MASSDTGGNYPHPLTVLATPAPCTVALHSWAGSRPIPSLASRCQRWSRKAALGNSHTVGIGTRSKSHSSGLQPQRKSSASTQMFLLKPPASPSGRPELRHHHSGDPSITEPSTAQHHPEGANADVN
ncbi:hypothetical protein P7K49_000542 [Saguinus oedipus]|uniref:Uncharacterized protein n=1 Tax=Saguinus oedipus TaxID=9490 RepID=A0ABQ9WBZ6_SAGOE|nr:hypothetical protein P7K49_000542 [Saguinus oedipus]